MAIQSSIVTRDLDKLAEPTGNIYESVVVVSKRAKQIAVNLKEELNSKLAEFATTVDNLEEVFENREQIEISKFYERMPKPTPWKNSLRTNSTTGSVTKAKAVLNYNFILYAAR